MSQIVQDIRRVSNLDTPRDQGHESDCTGCQNLSNLAWDTPRDQGHVGLACTGCQNLSNLTHQGTRDMSQIVQDVRTCLI